jgi:hypothetical protein
MVTLVRKLQTANTQKIMDKNVGTALHTVATGDAHTGVVVAGDALQEERAGEEHHGEHVRHAQGLPLVQQGTDKVPQELLEVQVSVLRRMKLFVK